MLYAHVEIEMPNVLIEGLSLERNVTKGLSSEKRNEVPFIREKRNEGRSLKTLDLAFRVSAVHQHFIFRFIIMSFISQGRNQAEIEFL